MTPDHVIPPHGGYRDLVSYQMSEIIYDATVVFCDRFINVRSRTHDQMVQAARSGKQNIAEGSMASGTSKKTELKLIGVARASLEELMLDLEDFLRQRKLSLWGKDHTKACEVRRLAYAPNRSYTTYSSYIEASPPEIAERPPLSRASGQLSAGPPASHFGADVPARRRFHGATLSGEEAAPAGSAAGALDEYIVLRSRSASYRPSPVRPIGSAGSVIVSRDPIAPARSGKS
jgi:restriction system protein